MLVIIFDWTLLSPSNLSSRWGRALRLGEIRLGGAGFKWSIVGVEGNERADQVAKQAAGKPPGRGPKEISLAFACRARTEAITAQKQRWLAKELSRRSQQGQRMYRPQNNWGGLTLQLL